MQKNLRLKQGIESLNLQKDLMVFKIHPDTLKLVTRITQVKNYARLISLCFFYNEIIKLSFNKEPKIAIIGGKAHEPEVKLLKCFIEEPQFIFLGIDPPIDQYLDLNLENFSVNGTHYDIILCSQVMEHIWNHKNAFKHFENLLASNGYAYISCPSSNRVHGSPNFFSAGFTPSFLINHAHALGLVIHSAQQFGSERIYNSVHLLDIWLSPKGHKFPILFCFEGKSLWKKFLLTIRYLPKILLLHLSSKKLTTSERYASESFIWVQKV